MKKIIYTLIICIIAILLAFVVSNIKNNGMSFDLGFLITKDTKLIDESFKVNRLQRKKSYYMYEKLNENEKKLYSELAKSVSNLDTRVSIHLDGVTTEEFSNISTKVIDSFFSDHPEVFYLNHKYETGVQKNIFDEKYYLIISYNVENKKDLEIKLNNMEKAINSIVDPINSQNLTLVEKEIVVHDELCKLSVYDYSKSSITETHTSYGALVDKLAVCDGLTKALQLLMDRISIDTVFVTGVIKEGPHAWLMANLEDEWYNVDITSNKSIENGKSIIHTYFNIDTETMKSTHVFDDLNLLPNAYKKNLRYYNVKDSYFDDNNTFEEEFKKLLNNSREEFVIEFQSNGIKRAQERFTSILSNDSEFKRNNTSGKINFYIILDTYVIENK